MKERLYKKISKQYNLPNNLIIAVKYLDTIRGEEYFFLNVIFREDCCFGSSSTIMFKFAHP